MSDAMRRFFRWCERHDPVGERRERIVRWAVMAGTIVVVVWAQGTSTTTANLVGVAFVLGWLWGICR